MNGKRCQQCVWLKECGCSEACEFYEPRSKHEANEMAAEEYEKDLLERHEYYAELVAEQQS